VECPSSPGATPRRCGTSLGARQRDDVVTFPVKAVDDRSIPTLAALEHYNLRLHPGSKIYMFAGDWCGSSHRARHFLPCFPQQRRYLKLTTQAAVVTSAATPLKLNLLRHTEAGVSGNCRKWSGAMLAFWHTTLLVGPQRRSQLDSSQCLDCDWSVAGSKTAIAIAEEAHVCISRVQPKPAARVPTTFVIKTA
jgi:hypothetical protein